MSDARKTLLLVGAALRSGLRWAAEHLYTALVLTPLVVGMTYATASRLAETLAQWHPSNLTIELLSVSFAVCLTGFGLSRASAELYHIRRPESSLDALPVSNAAHLHAALIVRLARASVTGALILAAALIAGRADPLRGLPSLALFVALTALSQLLAALNWIHWSHRREKAAAFFAIIVLAIAAAMAGNLLSGFIRGEAKWLIAAGVALIIALYLLLRRLHSRWRASDMEYARRLNIGRRWNVFNTAFEKKFGAVVSAQLARDLQLTLRAFSSAVYAVALLALLTLALLVTMLTGNWLPMDEEVSKWFDLTWLPSVMAVKAACVVATTALVSLLPVLIDYQLPHLWLERAAGTTGLDIWKAKMWYGRLVSLPAAPAVWIAAMLTARLPMSYALPLLAECLWLWWMVSSIAAALSFEMPTRAGLSIILMATLGLGAGAMAAMLWPFGLLLYVYAMHSLTERGRERVRYYLITEAD